jgi:predicted AlkP superfamily phosphohydrolase/phosphomutase
LLAVIVIDCAEHTILRELVATGRAPALASLIERGTTIPLSSEGDQMDGAVFQTLVTGTNPGKHGIHKYRQLVPGTYRYELSRAAGSPVPQIWRVLSERGRRSCVFDVPKAFPFAGLRGKLVAAWGSYSPAAAPGSVPAGLLERLEQRFGRHPQPTQRPLPLSSRDYARVLARLLAAVETRGEACRWMLEDGPWDFFMTAFSESHVGCHEFWHLRDPSHPLHDEESARTCGDAMERIYIAIDRELERLLSTLGSGAAVVVLSTQGVQHNYTGSHLLPAWLALRGGRKLERPGVFRFTDLLGSRARVALKHALPERFTDLLVRWKSPPRGDVFVLPGSEYAALLRVNLAGREPAGTVPAPAYRRTLEQLRDDLLRLTNPATGRQAVKSVIFTHDVHHGDCLDQLPDAIVCWPNDVPIECLDCPTHGRTCDAVKFTDMTHSMHTGEGMAVAAGPGVGRGVVEEPRDVMDLCATFYRLLGEEPPGYLDGKPIDLAAPARR